MGLGITAIMMALGLADTKLLQATGALGSIVLGEFAATQQDRFNQRVEFQLKTLGQRMITRSDFEEEVLKVAASDEFRVVQMQIQRAAIEATTEVKRDALASALVNSLIPPASRFSAKQMLLRALVQMSDEEIAALRELVNRHRQLVPEDAYNVPTDDNAVRGVSEQNLAIALGWNKDDTRIVFEGLEHLGLIFDPYVGTYDYVRGRWRLTALALRLVEWCSGGGQVA